MHLRRRIRRARWWAMLPVLSGDVCCNNWPRKLRELPEQYNDIWVCLDLGFAMRLFGWFQRH